MGDAVPERKVPRRPLVGQKKETNIPCVFSGSSDRESRNDGSPRVLEPGRDVAGSVPVGEGDKFDR